MDRGDLLRAACIFGHGMVVRELIRAGAVPTAAMLQSACASQRGRPAAVVRVLLDAGVPVLFDAMFYAIHGGNAKIVSAMLQAGAVFPDIMLTLACTKGHEAVVRALLAAGLRPTDADMQAACANGHARLTRILAG